MASPFVPLEAVLSGEESLRKRFCMEDTFESFFDVGSSEFIRASQSPR